MYALLLLLLVLQLPPAVQPDHQPQKIDNLKKQSTPKQEPPPSVTPSQRAGSQPSSTNTDDSKFDSKKDVRDWINAFSTAIIACLTLVTVFVIAGQLRATHRHERAWVVIEEIELPEHLSYFQLTFPVNVEMRYVFKNYGSTPARLTDSRLIFKLIDKIEDLPSIPEYGQKQAYPNFPKDGGILVPGATIPLHQPFQGPDGTPALNNAILSAIRDGSKTLVSYGFMKYRDAFNKRHETRFCHTYRVVQGVNYFSGDFGAAGPKEYNKHS